MSNRKELNDVADEARADDKKQYKDSEHFVFQGPKIAVIGVGGGGGNALENLIAEHDIKKYVRTIACNTDMQDLHASSCEYRIQLGPEMTKGLGAGGDPEQGALATQESLEEVMSLIAGYDMVFIACGEGGGTGTGSSEVIAKATAEAGILTLCVVTKPFRFEGQRRMQVAERGIAKLQQFADALVVIPNDNVLQLGNEQMSIQSAFKEVDRVLANFVQSITSIITLPGLVNIDFADVRSAFKGYKCRAIIGMSSVTTTATDDVAKEDSGVQRGIEAAEKALDSPLLEGYSLRDAPSVVVSVVGGDDLSIHEVNAAVSRIQQEVTDNNKCKFFFGTSYDAQLTGTVRVCVLATIKPTVSTTHDDETSVQSRGSEAGDEFLSAGRAYTDDDHFFGSAHDIGRPNTFHEDQSDFDSDEKKKKIPWWRRILLFESDEDDNDPDVPHDKRTIVYDPICELKKKRDARLSRTPDTEKKPK